jgi:hypothetical protein
MNLHDVVAGAIGSVNPHETVTIWRCTGVNVVKGVVSPVYAPLTRRAQIQQPSPSDLQQNERVARAQHSLKAWVNVPADTVNRNAQTAEDIIERDDGTYWLIVGIREAFERAGWVSVLAVEQLEPPEGVSTNGD